MKDLKIMLDGKEHTVKLLEERAGEKQKIYLLDFNVYKDIYKKEIKSIINFLPNKRYPKTIKTEVSNADITHKKEMVRHDCFR